MKNQKGFIPIIIILVVLIVFVSSFYLKTLKLKSITIASPSPTSVADPVGNLKTYDDQIGHFTFKYPKQWDTLVLCEKTEDPILMVAPQGIIDEIKKGPTCGFGTGKVLTLTIYTRSFENIIRSDDYTSVTNTSIKIDGKDATRYDSVVTKDLGPMQKGDRNMSVTIKKSGSEYLEIVLLDQKYVNVFDQIISTFEFTN
ncbi:MAG: hypothetical protein AAB872_00550 [Patescibacteria group bacterium]